MDEGFWECSVCTYQNRSEAFKCQICDTRKGTSTRKPRVTPSIVAQQIASSFPPIPPQLPTGKYQKTGRKRKSVSIHGKLKNIDRSSGEELEITVDGVTVLITDYKILPRVEDEDTVEESESKKPVPNDIAPSSSNSM